MTDKELLELAANAAGVDLVWESPFVALGDFVQVPYNKVTGDHYDPLTDDGDALRLAVKLHLSLDLFEEEIIVGYTTLDEKVVDQVVEPLAALDDPYAATRRAIVRVAAEIGKERR